MEYLKKQAKDNGVQIRRATVNYLIDAVKMHYSGSNADMLVNCSGLMASQLDGVKDDKVFPARGQMCLVKNKISGIFTTSGVDDVPSDTMYVMPRGRGALSTERRETVLVARELHFTDHILEHTLIGGSYQKGNWDSQADPELRRRILNRAIDLCPELADGKGIDGLNIVEDIVGLRPVRIDGTRLEKERVANTIVVHNYGHGGYGCD